MWNKINFKQLLLRTLTLCLRHALADNRCLFFALPQRIGEEKALKGLMPLRNPQRANDAALSLRSCLREVEHIQTLRSHLEV